MSRAAARPPISQLILWVFSSKLRACRTLEWNVKQSASRRDQRSPAGRASAKRPPIFLCPIGFSSHTSHERRQIVCSESCVRCLER